MKADHFGARRAIKTSVAEYSIYSLPALEEAGLTTLDRLPFSIRVLLESVLRQANGQEISERNVAELAAWTAHADRRPDVPFLPARVIMQDFTGVPAVVDLAAMRSALARSGGDPGQVNPQIPVDLVIDHSVQVDFFASQEALRRNAEIEFERNRERYEFLRWAQEAFDQFQVVPPATGIVHQVNLEYLAEVVVTRSEDGGMIALPDTLVGTDSHTTMINALGVLGWGVGGIEAEAAILGQPMVIVAPEVVGFRLTGKLAEGATATDLVLVVTQMLREHGVVGKFVEFTGPGLTEMSLPDRATIANMAPEYGATVGFFPVDSETLRYLRLTGRDDDLIELVERYCKEQGLFRTSDTPEPEFTSTLELDLGEVLPSLAGPRRPQDRIKLTDMKTTFRNSLTLPTNEGGFALAPERVDESITIGTNGTSASLHHGSVVIAAITSCTNTSNPSVMVAAGLLARNAVERGLTVPAYVKTSLAPGSRVVTEYLEDSGLLPHLATLGFNVVGYGCTTCIGNSGPLPSQVVRAISETDLVASAVLSGNRNFEGRISPHVRANYLASPPLVVAYALAGRTDIDLTSEPVGTDPAGQPVYLEEIWPSQLEILQVIEKSVSPRMFREQYSNVFTGNETWNNIPISGGADYQWEAESTYIQEPPFFTDLNEQVPSIVNIEGARALAVLGDSVTTDHISPAGAIPVDSPAGRYLTDRGVKPRDFNSFGSRRGNDQVMTRGTFGNIRLRNRMVPGVEGGYTVHYPDGQQMTIYDAAMKYKDEGVPLIVLAGKEYGTGSSRDWAAKGTLLLGVRAVIAQSYERIHRSNLIGMGVLPLEFAPGENAQSLGLTGEELFAIAGLESGLSPGQELTVTARKPDGSVATFQTLVRLDTPSELEIFRQGGVLHMVLRRMLTGS